MGFGDTGYTVVFLAFGFFTGSGFGFLLAFFLLVLGGTATPLVLLPCVFAVFAVGPAFQSRCELGHFLAVLVQPFKPRCDPVCFDAF
jgi:hypothetical protein